MSAADIIALIDGLPPDATDYYLWIASWPDTAAVRAAYRATPRGRALHAAVVARAPTSLHSLTPLLLLNAIPVAEDLLTLIAIRRLTPTPQLLTAFWELCASLPRPSRLLYDPTIREPFRAWITETAIPWWSDTDIAAIWETVILPTWEAVRTAPLPAIRPAVAAELVAAAWAPERVVGWCLPHDEAAALRGRWIGAAVIAQPS